ncbi:MAG: hypothetical protein QGI13_07460 [Rhodospirillales bacterium]|nr:hypothetical protein [Rhodospirillales bacterium]
MKGMADTTEWANYYRRPNIIDWNEVAESLMAHCREAGIYDPSRVRGLGAWRDGADTVFHAGGKLYLNGEETSFEEYTDTSYQYLAERSITAPSATAATPADVQSFTSVLESWDWEHSDLAPKLVLGWIGCGLVCGALSWRPHLWITGSKGTGKSTLDTLVANVLGKLCLSVQGSTTEPGLRQALNGNAIPVLFDEFEGSTQVATRVIEAARAAASDNAAKIIKGTPEGKAITYRLRFAAMFSGIIANVQNGADRSRIVFLEIQPKKHDETGRRRMLEALARYQEDIGAALLRRMLDALAEGLFEATMSVFRTEIRLNGGDDRKADVFAHLLASYHVLSHDAEITEAEAKQLVKLLDAFDDEGQSDEEECWSHLLGFMATVDRGDIKSIREWIACVDRGDTQRTSIKAIIEELARHGVALDGRTVKVSNTAPGIQTVYARTKWAQGGHARVLRRLSKATAGGNARFAGHQSRTTAIPLGAVVGPEEA